LHRTLKRKVIAGGAVLAVAALAGGAYAATHNSGPTTRQAFLDDVAKRLHVTPQQLTQALNGAASDQLQAAVKAGRLTQAQANALAQRLTQSGQSGPPSGFFGPRGLRGPWVPGAGPGGRGQLPAAAKYLGLKPAQLFQQLAGGKSLADLATAKGKSVSGLEQAMTAAFTARLDKALAAKRITAAQHQKVLSRFAARLSQEVNQKGLPVPPRRLFPRHLQLPKGAPAIPAPSPPNGAPAPPKGAPTPPNGAPAPPKGAPAPLPPGKQVAPTA